MAGEEEEESGGSGPSTEESATSEGAQADGEEATPLPPDDSPPVPQPTEISPSSVPDGQDDPSEEENPTEEKKVPEEGVDINNDDNNDDEDDLLLAVEGDEENDNGQEELMGERVLATTAAEPDENDRLSLLKSDSSAMKGSSSANDTQQAGKAAPDAEAPAKLQHQPSSLSTIENPSKLTTEVAPSAETNNTTAATAAVPPMPMPHVPVTLLSSSSIMERRVSVTSNRKHALLVEAREDRARWIRNVSRPYRQIENNTSDNKRGDSSSAAASSLESSLLARTHAVRRLPASLPLLSHLYDNANIDGDGGLQDPEMPHAPISERIQAVIQSVKRGGAKDDDDENDPALVSSEMDDSMLGSDGDEVDDEGHRSYLQEYRESIHNLLDPSCAVLVQGMRNFCKKLEASVRDPKDVASKIQAYLNGTIVSSLASNPLWNRSKQQQSSSSTRALSDADPLRRRALEAFMYGQCSSHFESVLWTDEAKRRESGWTVRMSELQFVTPRHLEIACLFREDATDSSVEMNLDELLHDSVAALLSVDAYYSPYDKLQRILALYRRVNAALSRALNPTSATAQSSNNKKLPSADDVLPTIILVVLRAQPRRLLHNLRFVEDYAPPEALRGEAGYAYTNLYGAVQFLLDLDLDVDKREDPDAPASLSMTAEEFRQGLLSCRQKTQELLNKPSLTAPSLALPTHGVDEEPLVEILPSEVRAARKQGEALDVEWALRLRQDPARNLLSLSTPRPGPPSASVSDELVADDLPLGFARSYSFLNARPDDIRVSDLPKLLDEYRMLVHTTEVLLREKSTRVRAERKAQRRAAEKEVYDRVRSVDPSLLLPHSSSSTKTSSAAADLQANRTMNGAV